MKLVISIIAPALTVLSYLAQTGKIMRTRDTSSLSTPMWILSIAAFAMWIVYGFTTGELPIIIPNIVCAILASVILVLKLKS